MKNSAGFTIVEMMVVVAVIGILVAVIIPNINQGSAQARDAERRAMVSTMGAAIELYKDKYGRYPVGCNDVTPDTNNAAWTGTWSGEPGTDYECDPSGPSPAEYIRGLAPEFIPVLPKDPFRDGITSRSYVYVTNADGSVYKFMSMDGAESETLTYADPLVRCGDMSLGGNQCASIPPPTGFGTYNEGGSQYTHCNNQTIYGNDYAIWGGYAQIGYSGTWRGNHPTNQAANERAREYFSDVIRCK